MRSKTCPALRYQALLLLMLSIASIALVPERAGTPYPNIDGSTTTNSSLSSSNNQPSSSSRGVYGKVEPVDTVDVSKIPPLDQANKDTGKPSGSLDPTNVLFAGSSRSATPQSSPMGPSSFTTASSSVSTSFVFNALSQNQSCYDFCVPPDVQVATGPTRILEMVNSAAEIFTKQGTSVTIVPIPKFFKLPVSDHIFDPKVLYDSLSGRWFASIGDEVTKNITIAVSFTNDPGGNWTLYQLAPSPYSNLADQPILGISGDKVVVSVNDFSISFATIFDGAQYWVLNKIEMLNRVQSIDYVSFGPDPELYSVHPAQSLGSTNTQYMVSNIFNPHTYQFVTNKMMFFPLIGVPPGPVSPQNSTISISDLPFPPTAAQLGSTLSIETGDFRVMDAAWYQGKLWIDASTTCVPAGDTTSRSCIRLDQIDTTNSKLLQDFNFSAPGQNYYYPALRIDKTGNLITIFGFSSQTNSTCCYPSLAISGQSVSDPLDSMAPPKVLRLGTGPSTAQVAGRVRYGDYFGAAVDPSDPNLVWIAGEYINASIGNCKNFDGTNTGLCWSTAIASARTTGFTLSTTQTYLDLAAGSSATVNVTLTSLGGFSGTVTLSSSVSPSGPSTSISPTSVSIPSNGNIGALLSISTSTSTSSGTYNVTVNAASASISYSATLTLRVGSDFKIALSVSTVGLLTGSSAHLSLALTSLNLFSGTVTLSVSISSSAGLSATIAPGSVNLSANGTSNSTLTLTAPTSSPNGTYRVSIAATGGSITHGAVVIANLSAEFGLVVNPTTFQFPTPRQFSRTSTVKMAAFNGFSGTVNLTAASSPAGISTSFNPVSIILGPNGTATLTVTLTSSANTPPGNHTITVSASSVVNGVTVLHTQAILVTVAPPDFAIQAFPNPVTLVAGVPGSSSTSITLTSTNNLVGTISLSTSAPPSGISATLNPSSVSLTANSTGTSTLSISNANSVPAGIYTLVVTGTNQSLTHSVMLQINVVDFTISASPSGLVIGTGTSGSTTILIGSLGSLTGNVNLTATVSSPGVTASLSATIIPVSQFATGTSALKITVSKSTPTNKYNVTVTGVTIVNGHTITHSTIVSVSLPPPDFSITATPSNLAANPDSSASSTILLTSLNNFAGTVTLSVTSPSTVTSSTSPTNLSLNAGTTATSTWSMSGTTRGTYTVTVSSSSGSLGHTISVTFTVGVGLVCIQDPTTAATFSSNPCPPTPAVFNGPTTQPSTQLRVGVYVYSSNSILDADIKLVVDPTILVPAGTDFRGNALGGNVYTDCIGGRGVGCAGTDGPNTIHILLSATAPYPSLATGLIFIAIFNITGLTPSSGISIGFQVGCSNTSTGDGTCVTIAAPSSGTDPEAVQAATFNNSAFSTTLSYVQISSNPTSIGPITPSTLTFTITATGKNGYPSPGGPDATVNFSFMTGPNFNGGITQSCDPSSGGTISNGSCSVALTVSSGTPAGTYSITIYGTYVTQDNSTFTLDTLVSPITVQLTIIDFSLTASPSTLTFTAGTSANATLTISSLNGFTGTINFSTTTSPTGPSVNLNQTTITLSSGSKRFISAIVTAASGGIFTLTVKATSGAYSKQIFVRLNVKDFSVSANPASLVANTGSPIASTIKLTSLGFFSGTVSLSATGSSSLGISLASSSLGVKANGTNSTLLTVTGSSTGNYTVTMSATSGSLTHSTSILVRIVDFGLSSSQTTIVFDRGSSANATIALNSINGFNSTVTLNAAPSPSGPTATMTPASVILRPGVTGTSTLTLSATASVTTGLYTLTLTGTSASRSHTITLTVAVTPTPFQVSDREVFTNVNVTTSGTLYLDSPANSLTVSGTLSVVAINSTTRAPIFGKNYTLTRQPLQTDTTGRYFTKFILDIAATATPLGSSITLTLSAPTSTTAGSPSTSVVVSRNPDVLQHGIEDVTDYGYVQVRFNCQLGQSCYDPRADVAARGIIDIVDIGIMNNFFNAIDFNQLQFNLTASQYSLTLQAGQQATVTIASAALGGFSGNIGLSTISSSGLGAVLNQTSIKSNGAAKLTLSANNAGNYTSTITGVAGGESHSFSILVRVIDFSISATPTSLTVVKGNTATSTLSLVSLNGFSGNVTLSATISPVVSSGPVVTFTPPSLVLTSNGSGTSTLKLLTASNTPKGTYTITVTATSGNLVHSLTINLIVTR